MEVAGREIKRVTLELGGSDPMIVMEDANVDLAVKMADIGRYFNCGQMCLGVKRLFVHESVAEDFVGKLAAGLQKKTVGDGTKKESRMGPLHVDYQRTEVEEQVEDAKARGAKAVAGGARPEGDEFKNGHFYLPTLLTDVPDDAPHLGGGVLRTGAAGVHLQGHRRGHRTGQRLGVRPGLVHLDQQHEVRQQGHRQAPGGQRVGQLAPLRL